MGSAFWLTVQTPKKSIPIPIVLLLPFALLLDILALIVLLVYAAVKRDTRLLGLSFRFVLTRLLAALILYGGPFSLRVREKGKTMGLSGGFVR